MARTGQRLFERCVNFLCTSRIALIVLYSGIQSRLSRRVKRSKFPPLEYLLLFTELSHSVLLSMHLSYRISSPSLSISPPLLLHLSLMSPTLSHPRLSSSLPVPLSYPHCPSLPNVSPISLPLLISPYVPLLSLHSHLSPSPPLPPPLSSLLAPSLPISPYLSRSLPISSHLPPISLLSLSLSLLRYSHLSLVSLFPPVYLSSLCPLSPVSSLFPLSSLCPIYFYILSAAFYSAFTR